MASHAAAGSPPSSSKQGYKTSAFQSPRWHGTGVIGLNRPKYADNLVQPVDTNEIDELLRGLNSNGGVEAALLPVLRYGRWFSPRQAAETLARLPGVAARQAARQAGGALTSEQQRVLGVVVQQLGPRLAAVLEDCSPAQVSRALWALGTLRLPCEDVLSKACDLIPTSASQYSMEQLATCAWGAATSAAAAAAGAPGPVSASGAPGSGAVAAVEPGAVMALCGPVLEAAARAAEDSTGELSHVAVCRLVMALAAGGLRDEVALARLAASATARLDAHARAHDRASASSSSAASSSSSSSSSPLAPRAEYLYRTVRGWDRRSEPRPGPPRASKYQRDTSPVVLRTDFDVHALSVLLAALARLGYRDDALLASASRNVQLMLRAQGAQVPPQQAARIIGALHRLGYRDPALVKAVVSSTPLTGLPAPQLAAFARLAAAAGLRSPLQARRVGLALYPHLQRLPPAQLAATAAALTKSGCRSGPVLARASEALERQAGALGAAELGMVAAAATAMAGTGEGKVAAKGLAAGLARRLLEIANPRGGSRVPLLSAGGLAGSGGAAVGGEVATAAARVLVALKAAGSSGVEVGEALLGRLEAMVAGAPAGAVPAGLAARAAAAAAVPRPGGGSS